MTVTIRFRGPIASKLSNGEVRVGAEEGATLRDALGLAIGMESYIAEVWRSPEEIDRDALVLLNGIDVGITGGLESEIHDGDVLIVLALVHGG